MNLRESIDRVLASPDIFGKRFYDRFFQQHPEVQGFFAETDLKRQAVMLTTALLIVEQSYSRNHLAAKHYLQYLGTQHKDRQIPMELYPTWRDTMLETLAAFHADDWNDELQRQWHEAFDQAIQLMFDGYRQHITI